VTVRLVAAPGKLKDLEPTKGESAGSLTTPYRNDPNPPAHPGEGEAVRHDSQRGKRW